MSPDNSGNLAPLVRQLRRILGDAGYGDDAATRFVYAHDASHMSLGQPLGVALPATIDELQQVLTACLVAKVPVVARGAGTGLSGGALPMAGALVVGTGRLRAMEPVNKTWGCVRVETGVPNEKVSLHAAPAGFHFAPDPSSQSTATIGGNIAENAGGPHCVRHGVTLQHLRRLHWIGSDGQIYATGHGVVGERGLDLVSLLCGSEGTLGVVTTADLKLMPNPPVVTTLLAFFPRLDEATRAVVHLLGRGMLPVAVEMVDQPMLRAVEQAFGFGFPTDVAAAMIVEFSGEAHKVAEDTASAEKLLKENGAREVRQAADEDERRQLWKCRKKAFGAVGRLAPSYVTMDVVVPLGHLPHLVAEIQEIKARHGVEIATAFHAGDGNLHPGVHYDDRDPQATARAHAAADEIIAAALARGGSATGEHGVGVEKLHVLPWQMDAVAARLHRDIKTIFDPLDLLNPGKLLPPATAKYASLKPLPAVVDFQWESLTVSASGQTRLSEIQHEALARGLWLPVGIPGAGTDIGLAYDPTVTELLDHLAVGPALFASGTARDFLLESWAEAGTGEVFHCGAPVFKNAAGYCLPQMLCGSGGIFVDHLAATFALRPRPERALVIHLMPESNSDDVLDRVVASLLNWLGTRCSGMADAQLAVDPAVGILVMIAGRDRPWDLGVVQTELKACLGQSRWQVTSNAEVGFDEVGELLTTKNFPSWLLGSSNWSMMAPLPTNPTNLGPTGAVRFIRQARTGRCWLPGLALQLDGWFSDSFLIGGQMAPLPKPAAEVPIPLLRAMKNLFDPHLKRPLPEWLSDKELADE